MFTRPERQACEPCALLLTEAGLPVRWLSWQDATTSIVSGDVAWSAGTIVKVVHGGTSRSGTTSVVQLPAVLAARTPHWAPVRSRAPLCNRLLFERDRYLCMYCGQKHRVANLTRDHVYPRCRGGLDSWENVVTACFACNQRKGGRSPEQAGMPLLAVPYVPSHAERLILDGRTILADQMEFLLAAVPASRRALYGGATSSA